MLIAYLIFALCAIFLLVALVFYFAPGTPRATSVPGPDPSDKNDGNLGDIARAGSLHEYLEKLHDEEGPIVSFWWGKQNVISICSAELFREQIRLFDRPVSLFEFLEPLISGDSIQFANGTDGKVRREKYDVDFTSDAVENYIPGLVSIATEMAKKWEEKFTGPGDHVPIYSFMTAFAIRSISGCCFGVMKDEDLVELSEEYVVSMDGIMRRWSGTVYPADDPREKRFQTSVKRIRAIIREAVDRRLKEREALEKAGAGEPGNYILLDRIIDCITKENHVTAELSESKKKHIIVADAVTYFIGGFHTTANLLTWCLYYLAKNRDVQALAREELVSVLGSDPSKQSIAKDNYSELSYCRAVVDETLRCGKVAPMAARCSDHECVLGRHVIPACTPIIHALGVSLDDVDFYPNPEKFDPERFLPDVRNKRPSCAFTAFGVGGKRKCPGFRFAYMEAMVLLSVVLRKFRLRLVDPDLDPIPDYGFVTKPKDEIYVFLDKLP